jgi:hypothetical protein
MGDTKAADQRRASNAHWVWRSLLRLSVKALLGVIALWLLLLGVAVVEFGEWVLEVVGFVLALPFQALGHLLEIGLGEDWRVKARMISVACGVVSVGLAYLHYRLERSDRKTLGEWGLSESEIERLMK